MRLYELEAKRSLLSKRLTVDQVFSHQDSPSPLATGILQGSELYLNLLPLKTLASAARPGSPAAAPAEPAEATAEPPAAQLDAAVPPAGTTPKPSAVVLGHMLSQAAIRARAIELAKSGDPEARLAAAEQVGSLSSTARLFPRLAGAVPPGALAKTSLNLMSFSQDMTHAQVAGHFQAWGLQPTTANSAADDVFKLFDHHGVSSVLAGVTVGSAVVAFLAVVKPTMAAGTRISIGVAAALVFGLLFYFIASRPNHFEGKWVASPSEAHYQPGPPPQASTCTFATSGTRLTISEDDLFANGKVRHIQYTLDADGFDHKVAPETGADKARGTIRDFGNKLEVIFKLKGKEIRRETRELSADHKEMTVTEIGLAPGSTYKNTSIYEKK
ncbi:MAG TPA: hypothetical protein VLZ50_02825 [Terracidiphilus sp.]|nr:hypothetical protein [Terracidiphilus sp.]